VFIEVTILIYNILEHTNELVITLNAKSKFDKKDKKGIRNTESNDKSSVDNANLTKNSKMLEIKIKGESFSRSPKNNNNS